MSFCCLTKGTTPKNCRLCVCVLLNVLLNLSCIWILHMNGPRLPPKINLKNCMVYWKVKMCCLKSEDGEPLLTFHNVVLFHFCFLFVIHVVGSVCLNGHVWVFSVNLLPRLLQLEFLHLQTTPGTMQFYSLQLWNCIKNKQKLCSLFLCEYYSHNGAHLTNCLKKTTCFKSHCHLKSGCLDTDVGC